MPAWSYTSHAPSLCASGQGRMGCPNTRWVVHVVRSQLLILSSGMSTVLLQTSNPSSNSQLSLDPSPFSCPPKLFKNCFFLLISSECTHLAGRAGVFWGKKPKQITFLKLLWPSDMHDELEDWYFTSAFEEPHDGKWLISMKILSYLAISRMK